MIMCGESLAKNVDCDPLTASETRQCATNGYGVCFMLALMEIWVSRLCVAHVRYTYWQKVAYAACPRIECRVSRRRRARKLAAILHTFAQ